MLRRGYRVIDTYLLGALMGRTTTASFWYIPEPPAVYDAETLDRYEDYRAHGVVSPVYPIDHRQKTAYDLTNSDGIIVLKYPEPVGEQINPEAAFQFALGLHDRFIAGEGDALRDQFLHYAAYFRDRQTEQGDFNYEFDWAGWKAPWTSALAQSRGVSVMLRAYLLTQDETFAVAARRGLSKFSVQISDGGYLGISNETGCPYFEEYPPRPSAVINGFMAAAIAPWEVARWLGDEKAAELAAMAKQSIEKMLPHYTTSWWTLYDHNPETPFPNYHSPRYQIMCVGYLKALSRMFRSEEIARHAAIWEKQLTPLNKARATVLKFVRKAVYE
ncbi:D-glucuronyl C5-epimerase family protein [Caulobacter mirabilis]|uniref:D-glucuronyl C5-epimerase family protein n=1 Tax=Caulobacter mirabilis TaxID=69666 RepID=UPI001559894A|nr:D-glucuronyl C5-epimerase family protein [Caulobacter mirabilis]